MLTDSGHCKIAKALISSAREMFGADLRVTMEQFFTQVEFLRKLHIDLKIDRGRVTRKYDKIRRLFFQAVGCLLEASTEGPQCVCTYHQALASALQAGDAVLTFNYDTLMDAALKARGGHWWRANDGYGVSIAGGADPWDSPKTRGKPCSRPIKLLKLHGSLNWEWDEISHSVTLTSSPYNPDKFLIIPPAVNKDITGHPVLNSVWKEARSALRLARVILVIGYSVPETDLLAQALLRVDPAWERSKPLTHLILVNPEGQARGDMVRLVARAIDGATRVVWEDRFSDLVPLLASPGNEAT